MRVKAYRFTTNNVKTKVLITVVVNLFNWLENIYLFSCIENIFFLCDESLDDTLNTRGVRSVLPLNSPYPWIGPPLLSFAWQNTAPVSFISHYLLKK